MLEFPTLRRTPSPAKHSLTSIPWPVDRDAFPAVDGVEHQVVNLFEPALKPRLKRFLLLTHSDTEIPAEIKLKPGRINDRPEYFSNVKIQILREALDTKQYVYRECEARISV